MEKNYNQRKLNNYLNAYNIEKSSTPLKQRRTKVKEITLNNFLQETYNQKKQKEKTNSFYEKFIGEQNPNKIHSNIIEKKSKNMTKNCSNIYNQKEKNNNKYNIPIYSLSRKKSKNAIDIINSNTENYKILNSKNRKTSCNKTSFVASNENQISILNNKKHNYLKHEKSFHKSSNKDSYNSNEKKNKKVYIKKNLSVEKNLKPNKNISQDNKNKYLTSQENSEKKYCTPSIIRRESKDISNKNETNNINSNVNIFNFGMQYNNAPHFFIKNSRLFNPYFNDYFEDNMNIENRLNNFSNIISLKKSNPNFNLKINHNEIIKESAIMIQSAFRGCFIRLQINNRLKIYKGIEILILIFKNKFWNYFKNNLMIKINIINNEIDTKTNISSTSFFSVLNSNKIYNNNKFNPQNFKETKKYFSILNNNNIKNNNYIQEIEHIEHINSFKNINRNKAINNEKLIWNKKSFNKNNSIISNIINQKLFSKNVKKLNIEKKSLSERKEQYLKMLITKKCDKMRLILLKYFLRFYYNGILNNKTNVQKMKYNKININIEEVKLLKLKNIIEYKKKCNHFILYKYFSKFNFKCILNYIQNHQYLIINGGRLKNINEDPFFIYEFDKNKNQNEKESHRNIKIILKKIINLRKIILDKKRKNEIIRKYFHKFRMSGIRHYMSVELKKKLIVKLLILKDNNNNFKNISGNKGDLESKRYKILNKLVLKYKNNYSNCCKNIFDKWNLRTKIFSMITKDKEKKKKRRIKKRYNKKLASNINNINNNNNIDKNNNIINSNSNIQINVNYKKNELNNLNYAVGHPDSIIFINNLIISDYFTITKFMNKINGVITKKFFFFQYIIKKNKKEKEDKNSINKEVDFFMENSSESEN